MSELTKLSHTITHYFGDYIITLFQIPHKYQTYDIQIYNICTKTYTDQCMKGNIESILDTLCNILD